MIDIGDTERLLTVIRLDKAETSRELMNVENTCIMMFNIELRTHETRIRCISRAYVL